jgi:hypothetical protein
MPNFQAASIQHHDVTGLQRSSEGSERVKCAMHNSALSDGLHVTFVLCINFVFKMKD